MNNYKFAYCEKILHTKITFSLIIMSVMDTKQKTSQKHNTA